MSRYEVAAPAGMVVADAAQQLFLVFPLGRDTNNTPGGPVLLTSWDLWLETMRV